MSFQPGTFMEQKISSSLAILFVIVFGSFVTWGLLRAADSTVRSFEQSSAVGIAHRPGGQPMDELVP